MPDSYQPYAQDRNKQARFDAFLRDEAEGMRSCEQAARRPGEGKQEMTEFTKVAAFFSRPKHAIISDRFTSGEIQTSDTAATVGLARPAPKPDGWLAASRSPVSSFSASNDPPTTICE